MMTGKQQEIPERNEITDRNLPYPFKSKKEFKEETAVLNSTVVKYPDGQKRIFTCSLDQSLRVFNLEEEKCEKIIKHSTTIYSIHFYEEEEVLMTTGWNGELLIWNLFPEIEISKRIEVAKPGSSLSLLTQISSTDFFCCVSIGTSIGSIYRIKYNNNNNIWISEEVDYPSLNKNNNKNNNNNNSKESVKCICQLITKKSIILFAGGNYFGGEDYCIKSIDIDSNNKFQRFPKQHPYHVTSLISYINSKNEETILSGTFFDYYIHFWNLEGEYLKQIRLNGMICCFLKDFSRNNIFIAGGPNQISLYSFSIEAESLEKTFSNFHSRIVNSMKWIDEETQSRFVSCSCDKTFHVYQLEDTFKTKLAIQDLNERLMFLMNDYEFILDGQKEMKMMIKIKVFNYFEECFFKSLFNL